MFGWKDSERCPSDEGLSTVSWEPHMTSSRRHNCSHKLQNSGCWPCCVKQRLWSRRTSQVIASHTTWSLIPSWLPLLFLQSGGSFSKDLEPQVRYKPKAASVTAKINHRNEVAFTFISSPQPWVPTREFLTFHHLQSNLYFSGMLWGLNKMANSMGGGAGEEREMESVCKQETSVLMRDAFGLLQSKGRTERQQPVNFQKCLDSGLPSHNTLHTYHQM